MKTKEMNQLSMDIIEKELEKIDVEHIKNKRIFLMGRIEHIKKIVKWLYIRNILVEAILDNDKKKQGLCVDGIPILAPKCILCPHQRDVCIIIYSPKYWEDMCEQLLAYGYLEEKNIYVLDKPSLEKNTTLVKEGVYIYQELQKRYGKDVQVFLANCPLGDFYLLGLYFYQYCKQNQIKSYVIIGESKGIEKLSSIFFMKETQLITTKESNALIRAWIFLGEDIIHIKMLTIWQGGFRFNPCQLRQNLQFSFMNTFTKMIYSLDNPVPQHPIFIKDKEAMEIIFKQYGLQPFRTVILSPFSYSLQPLPSEFWIRLARILSEKGYSVAVNAGGEQERNFIADAVTLHMNFSEIVAAMELAGTVIGMRSGFFDITSQAECRRIVLYPPSASENVVWNSTDIEFCSLKRMGLCEDAYEWETKDVDEIYKKILTVL